MDYYSDIAAGYDELHGAEQDAKLAELLSRVSLRHNLTVLDVGCGTGRSAAKFDEYDAQWHGIDPSPGLLARVPMSLKHRVKLAPAENIPWPNVSFDVVLSLTALQNFTNSERGLQEIRRVAKPGALVMITFLRKAGQRALLDEHIRKTFSVKDSFEFNQDVMYICEN